MNRYFAHIVLAAAMMMLVSRSPITLANEEAQWLGQGEYRLLMEVPPAATTSDRVDERVAACPLEFSQWLAESGVEGWVDLSSLQLHKYDPQTGLPQAGLPHKSARSPMNWPCRYEDDLVPDEYHTRVGRASESPDGRPPMVLRRRKGRLFNREMSAASGKLIWAHRESSGLSAHYALYFDVRQDGIRWQVSPAPWLGDADILRREEGASLSGLSHFTLAVGDLNDDGLFDLVAGTEKGDLMWYPNRGRVGAPMFIGCHLLQDESGPIDAGWYAAPFLFDWDNDGQLDLLVGTSGNVIVWWRGSSDQRHPHFAYRGFVKSDGGRLEVPESPVAEDETGIFRRDYYNQPWIGDFNGDTIPDIVTGGYTTGRVFWFRGTGREPDGIPTLRFAGAIEADGGPIDTVWAASPSPFAVNADGKLDLLTGGWWWSGIPTAPGPGDDDLLRLYRGHGHGGELQFSRVPFPRQGRFPSGAIARPMVVEVNDDGRADLVFSHSPSATYIALNTGTENNPTWDMRTEPLTVAWGFEGSFDVTVTSADVNGDGQPEVLLGNQIWTLTGTARSPEKTFLGVAHVDGRPIEHRGPGYGDPYYFSLLSDWNRDGDADIVWGTQQGEIFLHRHLMGDDPLAFQKGVRLRTAVGEPLRVGPRVVDSADEATDFTILQGSRIVLAVEDFDQDGIGDLIVGETFGNLWVYRGLKDGGEELSPGVLITKLPTRPNAISCTDWNEDGLPDILIGGTAAKPGIVYLNCSQPGHPAVHPGQPVGDLPYLFWGPKLRATDWNGDGDLDLMVQSEFYSFWIERSFLQHGYQAARVVRPAGSGQLIQKKPER